MTMIDIRLFNSASSSPRASLQGADIGIGDEFLQVPSDLPEYSRTIPPLTDPEQAYFWEADWQAGERAADEQLLRGDAPTFHSIEDGMRWLLSDE